MLAFSVFVQRSFARQMIERDIDRIERNLVPVLSYLVWVLNEEQASQLAASLLANTSVIGVSIELAEGVTLFADGEENAAAGRTYQTVLSYETPDERRQLGTLTVRFRTVGEYAGRITTSTIYFIEGIAVVAVLSIILIVVMQRSVARPLKRLVEDIDRVDFTKRFPAWWSEATEDDPVDETRRVRTVISMSSQRVLQEIEERKMTERRLAASLEEKEVLLREVHHRVKNNLQLVVSLLSLQRRTTVDPNAVKALTDTESRIMSMSLVHDLLHTGETIAAIPFAEYLRELGNTVLTLSDRAIRDIRIDYDLDDTIDLDIELAIPIGLVATELITNAVKHAFVGRPEGSITVRARRRGDEGEYFFSVEDDGCGYAAGDSEAHIGLDIVETLCRQIDGTFTIETTPEGTRGTVIFAVTAS